jgi:glycosyltransferase involved in cell wall biosynthesis
MSEEQMASVAAEDKALEEGRWEEYVAEKNREAGGMPMITNTVKEMIAEENKPLKICIISSAAIGTPPQESEYAGLEVMTGNLAVELARRGHHVVLFSAKGSRLVGHWEFEVEGTGEKGGGELDVYETVEPTMKDAAAEFNHFQACNTFILEHFGKGQGVVIDMTWTMWAYFMISGLHANIFGIRVDIDPHPDMKLVHMHHGMPNASSIPPNVKFPRILGTSTTHAYFVGQIMRTYARYIWHGIELPEVTLEDCTPTSPDFADGQPYLLSLNRMTDEKGIHDSIGVAVQAGMKIVVAGDDTKVRDSGYVAQMIELCRNTGNYYYGLIDSYTKEELLKHCSALITCPITQGPKAWVEAFGLAQLEAMAYFKPVLSTMNGGIKDTVVHGQTGFLAETPQELVQYVSRLSEIDPNACRKRVEEHFTIEKMGERWEQLLRDIMNDVPSSKW